MADFTCIGVLAHPLRPNSYPVAETICQTIAARGLHSWCYTSWKDEDVREDIQRADAVIAIGGDGAMLRAARVCAPYQVPVLGINMGNLGFLTEIIDSDKWEPGLDKVIAGDYWIESRMMIQAAVIRNDDVFAQGVALNDVVISGSVVGKMIQLETYIDGDWITTYFADSLVIATATGSTAYALALGGPILPPELKNILLVPAAPHLSMDRPIVLSEGAQVDVLASSSSGSEILLSADGAQVTPLEPEDCVRVWVGEHDSRFIRLRGRNYFYRSLLDRLEPRVQRERYKKQRRDDKT